MTEVALGAMSAILVGTVGLLLGRYLESRAEMRRWGYERKQYLQERREEAYIAWLTAVPQLATAFGNRREAVFRLAGKEDEGALAEIEDCKRVVREIEIDAVRSALNRVRLYGSAEIVDGTRTAFALLIEADERCALSIPPTGHLELGAYRQAFGDCLRQMRKDVGSAVVDERFDPAGQADRQVIRQRLLAET